jgi:hypothetical protein
MDMTPAELSSHFYQATEDYAILGLALDSQPLDTLGSLAPSDIVQRVADALADQRQRIAALEAALAALIEGAFDDGVRTHCPHCHAIMWNHDNVPLDHTADCPITVARALLPDADA